MGNGSFPVAMVAGEFGVKFPVLELMVNIETVLSCRFTTYANLLDGSTATHVGPFPVATVPPGVSVPSLLIV